LTFVIFLCTIFYLWTKEKKMSKPKYGNSNLYMNTKEFADLVIEALHEQKYFNKNEVAHPGDIAFAFSAVAETIGSTMTWAISQEHQGQKNAVMETGSLRKNGASSFATEYGNLKNYALPLDDEIAPIAEDQLGYSEYRHKNAYM
jgi:hypothetical protein